MFSFLRNRSSNQKIVARLYHRIAEAALRPAFFTELGVPDTLEGRFEILALHMAVVLRHMNRWPAPAEEAAGDLTDYYFARLDDVLRELGTSDNKVPKKMRQMAAAYLLRAEAYDKTLGAQDADGLRALLTEYFGDDADVAALARYVMAVDGIMNDCRLDVLLDKGIVFPVPS